MPFGLGMPEMVLFAFIALLLFGKRLPELARSMGQSINAFKDGMKDKDSDPAAITDSP